MPYTGLLRHGHLLQNHHLAQQDLLALLLPPYLPQSTFPTSRLHMDRPHQLHRSRLCPRRYPPMPTDQSLLEQVGWGAQRPLRQPGRHHLGPLVAECGARRRDLGITNHAGDRIGYGQEEEDWRGVDVWCWWIVRFSLLFRHYISPLYLVLIQIHQTASPSSRLSACNPSPSWRTRKTPPGICSKSSCGP